MKFPQAKFTSEYYHLWTMGLLPPTLQNSLKYSVTYRKTPSTEISAITVDACNLADALERACYIIAQSNLIRPEDADLQAVYDDKNTLLWIDDGSHNGTKINHDLQTLDRRDFLTIFGTTSAAVLLGLPHLAEAGTSAVTLSGSADGFSYPGYMAIAHGAGSNLTIYGFGLSGDTFDKINAPSTPPSASSVSVSFSADGVYLAVGCAGSRMELYKRSGNVFSKLPDPATMPPSFSTYYGIAFSSDGNYLAVAATMSPYMAIYKRAGDTFTRLADPASVPTGNVINVAFSSDNTYLALTNHASPFLFIYKRSGDTFTKLANPASLPPAASYGIAFSADTTYLAVTHETSPYFTIYKRSGDTFTKLANPSVLPAGTGTSCAFSADGTYLSVTTTNSPYVLIYKRSGDTFTKLSDPANLPSTGGQGVAFSSDGLYMTVVQYSSPYVYIYKRSGDTFTQLSNPAVLPAGGAQNISFYPRTF